MARVVRVIEYLGTEEQLKAWMEHSCRDGVSPMFAPHQMTVWTVLSDVPGIQETAGAGRPLQAYEHSDYGTQGKAWREELIALQAVLGTHLGVLPADYAITAEDNDALRRILDRVQLVLAEDRGRT